MYGLAPPLVFLSLNSGFGSGPYKPGSDTRCERLTSKICSEILYLKIVIKY